MGTLRRAVVPGTDHDLHTVVAFCTFPRELEEGASPTGGVLRKPRRAPNPLTGASLPDDEYDCTFACCRDCTSRAVRTIMEV